MGTKRVRKTKIDLRRLFVGQPSRCAALSEKDANNLARKTGRDSTGDAYNTCCFPARFHSTAPTTRNAAAHKMTQGSATSSRPQNRGCRALLSEPNQAAQPRKIMTRRKELSADRTRRSDSCQTGGQTGSHSAHPSVGRIEVRAGDAGE
jgi:hypothetical protein